MSFALCQFVQYLLNKVSKTQVLFHCREILNYLQPLLYPELYMGMGFTCAVVMSWGLVCSSRAAAEGACYLPHSLLPACLDPAGSWKKQPPEGHFIQHLLFWYSSGSSEKSSLPQHGAGWWWPLFAGETGMLEQKWWAISHCTHCSQLNVREKLLKKKKKKHRHLSRKEVFKLFLLKIALVPSVW